MVIKRIAIVQCCNLGDVMMTFPMAGLLRRQFPDAEILLIARRYAEQLVESCGHIDRFVDSEALLSGEQEMKDLAIDVLFNPAPHYPMAKLAHSAGIPVRVGNLRRHRQAIWCNRFVSFGMKRSKRHMTELYIEHLRPLGVRTPRQFESVHEDFGLVLREPLAPELGALLDQGRFNLILHPLSKLSAREWPLGNFLALADLLPADSFKVFLTGSLAEAEAMAERSPQLVTHPNVTSIAGRTSVRQLMAFIAAADGMVCNSTGPVHIAAGLGKRVLGLYPPRFPIDPGRWRPLGPRAETLTCGSVCLPGKNTCDRDNGGLGCPCMDRIRPDQVAARLMGWLPPGETAADGIRRLDHEQPLAAARSGVRS